MSTDKLPQNYDDLKETLDKLFEDWKEAIKKLFITDGALPGYCEQKLKILYLAREMHTTEGLKDNPEKRNIVEFVDAFLSGCRDSSDHSSEAYAVKQITADGNDLQCWRLSARIAYCVCQGGKIGLSEELSPEELQKKLEELWKKPSFEELQSAYNENEFSFAILEVSKYNNIVKSKKAPGISDVFRQCAYKSLEFIRREIDIINPDLIISWNLRGAFKKDEDGKGKDEKGNKNNGDCFLRGLTGSGQPDKEPSENIRIWTYTFDKRQDATGKKKQIPLLDTWHFSPMGKSPKKDIYDPVMSSKVVQDLIKEKKAQDKKKS